MNNIPVPGIRVHPMLTGVGNPALGQIVIETERGQYYASFGHVVAAKLWNDPSKPAPGPAYSGICKYAGEILLESAGPRKKIGETRAVVTMLCPEWQRIGVAKYRIEFLGMNKAETKREIRRGTIKIADLTSLKGEA